MNSLYTKKVNYLFESIQTESEVKESEGRSIINSILNELKLNMKMVFVFGGGIGSFIGPVTDLLNNEGFNMSKEEIGLLLIASFAILLKESPELIDKVKGVLKQKDLLKHLGKVSDFIDKSKKLVSVVAEKVGKVVHGISDILGFTFLLVPTMKMVGEVINDNHITSGSLSEFITGLSIAVGVYGFKSVLGKVLDKKDDKPYEEKVEEGYHIRTFSKDTNESELVWHRDKEDRIVESIGDTDWMLQLDNNIPTSLTEKVSIPKNTYHRVIKGSGDLKVRIKKLTEDVIRVNPYTITPYSGNMVINNQKTKQKFTYKMKAYKYFNWWDVYVVDFHNGIMEVKVNGEKKEIEIDVDTIKNLINRNLGKGEMGYTTEKGQEVKFIKV